MRYLALIIGYLLFSVNLTSQEIDSIYTLPSLEISAERLQLFSAGQKLEKIDSIILKVNQPLDLGDMLSRNSTIQIKSYNHNGLKLISFRGTSAHHTGIYWNGFQLNPPNNGQVDLSLIPVGYFSSISILYGGSSSLYGSGNIGGAIHLNNKPNFKTNTTGNFQFSIGSFGETVGSYIIKTSTKKWFSKSGVIYKIATNDFEYTDLKNQTQKQKNAVTNQYGLMQDIAGKIGDNSLLGISLWYQSNERQIPATLTTKESAASQLDQSIKTAIKFKRFFGKSNLQVKTAFFDDYEHYIDPLAKIDSEIKARKSITDVQYQYLLNSKIDICFGAVYNHEVGESVNYDNIIKQDQWGVFGLWAQYLPGIKWKLNLNLRKDFADGYDVPFTPSLGFEGILWRMFSAKLNISRNYRIPSFNDRYWMPGGNENLRPEDSWNEEVSLIVSGGKRLEYSFITTLYNSNVDDWILWVPSGLLWAPQNIQKVWSRGIELEGQLNVILDRWKLKFQGGYVYALSTNEKEIGPNDESYQKQLLYVPEHRVFMNFLISFNNYSFHYNHNYTGVRYTSVDNEEFLPAYGLGNISLRKDFYVDQHNISFQVDVLNCWNVDYQAVLYNPMPGRYFKISISYNNL